MNYVHISPGRGVIFFKTYPYVRLILQKFNYGILHFKHQIPFLGSHKLIYGISLQNTVTQLEILLGIAGFVKIIGCEIINGKALISVCII